MNAKALRNASARMKKLLLKEEIPQKSAWQSFMYLTADFCLKKQNLPFCPEQLIPEWHFPEEVRFLRPELEQILQESLTEQSYPVQIAGWMHQYYQNDEKDKIFADKKHAKFAESEIPAVTQFFTPEWIASYLLENSLGRMFPGDWQYLLDRNPEDIVSASPEDIRLLDPCAGTGHILLTAFDMFMKIYQNQGISPASAVRMILQKNLSGLELDIHACRIAEFSLLLKALAYDPDFLKTGIRPDVQYFPPDEPEGSLRVSSARPGTDRLLHQKYQIVITNPPYMGSSGMPESLRRFVRTEFPDSWRDLYACFIERCSSLTEDNGFCAMLTIQNWLFLPAFASLRGKILHTHVIRHMLHLGMYAFDTADVGTIVQSVCWVMQKRPPASDTGMYYQLCDDTDTERKKDTYLQGSAPRYAIAQEQFFRIPDSPVIYWASEAVLRLFQMPQLGDSAEPKQGITTSDNSRFVRFWHEVSYEAICFGAENQQQAEQSGKKWFPYHKGGGYRKWYGNHMHVLNYENGGKELLAFHEKLNLHHTGGRLKNKQYYFRPAVTWTFIAKSPSFRKNPAGFLFDVAGSCLFADSEQEQNALLAFLCSKPAEYLLYLRNPTMNIQARDLKYLPYLKTDSERIQELAEENIQLCREDWNSFETSWDFEQHPLL